jgi:hypothetical protein
MIQKVSKLDEKPPGSDEWPTSDESLNVLKERGFSRVIKTTNQLKTPLGPEPFH